MVHFLYRNLNVEKANSWLELSYQRFGLSYNVACMRQGSRWRWWTSVPSAMAAATTSANTAKRAPSARAGKGTPSWLTRKDAEVCWSIFLSGCDHKCEHSKKGANCSCRKGYTLMADEK